MLVKSRKFGEMYFKGEIKVGRDSGRKESKGRQMTPQKNENPG